MTVIGTLAVSSAATNGRIKTQHPARTVKTHETNLTGCLRRDPSTSVAASIFVFAPVQINLKRILKESLLHFLLLGAANFVAYSLVSKSSSTLRQAVAKRVAAGIDQPT